jgi:glycosyltransferase involved in cell wall biosynthesis
MQASIDVSIVIPTLGRRKSLAAVVESAQEHTRTATLQSEVIVGLDTSSRAASSDAIRTLPHDVKVIKIPGRGPSQARNIAAKHASGRILAFLDDDILVEKGWGSALRSLFLYQDQAFIAAGGIGIPSSGTLPRRIQEQGAKWFGPEPRRLRRHEYGAAGHTVVSRSAWKRLGGFSGYFGQRIGYSRNEDMELYCRARLLGIETHWEPELRATHLDAHLLSLHDHFEQGRADLAIDLHFHPLRCLLKAVGYVARTALSGNAETRLRSQAYLFEALSVGIVRLSKGPSPLSYEPPRSDFKSLPVIEHLSDEP